MTRAIFETKDKQLIPLDDIQHINGRMKEHLKAGYETITVMYKDGMRVEIPAIEYDRIKAEWEARKNGKR